MQVLGKVYFDKIDQGPRGKVMIGHNCDYSQPLLLLSNCIYEEYL
jgi:hypothetical protein